MTGRGTSAWNSRGARTSYGRKGSINSHGKETKETRIKANLGGALPVSEKDQPWEDARGYACAGEEVEDGRGYDHASTKRCAASQAAEDGTEAAVKNGWSVPLHEAAEHAPACRTRAASERDCGTDGARSFGC